MRILVAALIAIAVLYFLFAGAGIAYVFGAFTILVYIAADKAPYLAALPQFVFSDLNLFALMAMPLFILVGEIMNRGGITLVLVEFSNAIVRKFRGDLGHVNIMTSVFFAGISGAAMADAAALSNTLVPAMRKKGFSAVYAGAVTAASSVIGPIIPPSIIMIFYGAIMGVDVAALFAAGIVPGLLMASGLLVGNSILSRRHKVEPEDDQVPLPIMRSLVNALPALTLPVMIVAGIIFGVMTPTEAAGVSVALAIVVGYHYRSLSLEILKECLVRTIVMSGSIFMIFATAAAIAYIAALMQIPSLIADTVLETGLSGIAYLLILMVVYLIMGMFLDIQISLALVAPLLIPAAIAGGADPVHIGILVCLNLAIALISPPLGGSTLVVSSVTGVNYWELTRAILPFLVIEIFILILIMLFPELTLALPRSLGLL